MYSNQMVEHIMSFDVGIKNMAYCIFEIDSTNTNNPPFKIKDWNVLNLMEKEEPHLFCNCPSIKIKEKKERFSKKPKKVVSLKKDFQKLENFFINSQTIEETKETKETKLCGRAAKYRMGESIYCEKHAKSQTNHIIPTKKISPSFLKKGTLEELSKICAEYSILGEGEIVKTKKACLEKMDAFFKMKCLETIIEQKSKRSGDTDLIVVGKNMKKLLNEIPEIERIDRVIIENQISPIANRMKTVQGMLAQYFIMKNTDIHIDFISSANKLKCFTKSTMKPEESSSSSQKYSKHKKDGVFYSMQILEKNPWLHIWNSQIVQSKKKDDLADCFLQGIWFLNSREKILLKDDLQIIPIEEEKKNNI